MHHVRLDLVERQAASAGLELWPVALPPACPNEVYEARLGEVWQRALARGVGGVAFGDLFLADIRAYRERQLAAAGLEPLFPLWRRDTRELAREMIAGGLEATVTAVDSRALDGSFVGRRFDTTFLRDLPSGVDPCGENGEFHTFAHGGPMFTRPIAWQAGGVRQHAGLVQVDLWPVGGAEGERTSTG